MHINVFGTDTFLSLFGLPVCPQNIPYDIHIDPCNLRPSVVLIIYQVPDIVFPVCMIDSSDGKLVIAPVTQSSNAAAVVNLWQHASVTAIHWYTGDILRETGTFPLQSEEADRASWLFRVGVAYPIINARHFWRYESRGYNHITSLSSRFPSPAQFPLSPPERTTRCCDAVNTPSSTSRIVLPPLPRLLYAVVVHAFQASYLRRRFS